MIGYEKELSGHDLADAKLKYLREENERLTAELADSTSQKPDGELLDQAVAFAEMWGTEQNWQHVRDAYIAAILRERAKPPSAPFAAGFLEAARLIDLDAAGLNAGCKAHINWMGEDAPNTNATRRNAEQIIRAYLALATPLQRTGQ